MRRWSRAPPASWSPTSRRPPPDRRPSTPRSGRLGPSSTCRRHCSRGSAGWRPAGRWWKGRKNSPGGLRRSGSWRCEARRSSGEPHSQGYPSRRRATMPSPTSAPPPRCSRWLENPVSQASAHYVVNEDGSAISQLVLERNRAWHIAALYDCTLNRRHDCWLNGVQSNHFTVGIEHAGFASQDSFPRTQLDASAALVCDVTRDHGIPRDWQHIVGHGQLQPANRTDPGPHWPWVAYLHRVQARCGELVVDDSPEFNDLGVATAAVPAAWPASDTTPDFYGGGYRWAPTQPDAADSAVFSFLVATAGPRTVDARWTSGSNRSPLAAYAVVTAAGNTVATLTVDQRTGGGSWHTLGTWTLPPGWNRVVLLRRGASGSVVVADAVRVRE